MFRVVGWRRRSINIGFRGSDTSGNETKRHSTNHSRPMPRASRASHFRQCKLQQNYQVSVSSKDRETKPLYSDLLNHCSQVYVCLIKL